MAGLEEEGGEITLLTFFSSLPLESSCWRSLLVDPTGGRYEQGTEQDGKGHSMDLDGPIRNVQATITAGVSGIPKRNLEECQGLLINVSVEWPWNFFLLKSLCCLKFFRVKLS